MSPTSVVRRWVPAAGLLAMAAASAVAAFGTGGAARPLLVAAALVAAAWLVSPVFAPSRRRFAGAREEAAERAVPVILWRPGCFYCTRLRLALGTVARRAVWVDIWADPDAAGFVRSVNSGNETVPTVIAGETVRTNPGPSWVRHQISGGTRRV